MNNMLTLEEVRNYLEIEQAELERLLKDDRLRAYKIGGTYIRFRKEDVLNLRHEVNPGKIKAVPKMSAGSRIRDFWHFNNFYILSIILVITLIVVVLKL